jgi:hypothetical protein
MNGWIVLVKVLKIFGSVLSTTRPMIPRHDDMKSDASIGDSKKKKKNLPAFAMTFP